MFWSQPCACLTAEVEIVIKYKYLGNVIDNQLNGNENVNTIVKKANKRMYFLRKLKSMKMNGTVLTMFYNCIVQSTITFCMSNWFNLCNVAEKKKLARIVKCAKKLGCNVNDLESLYHVSLSYKLGK